MNIHSAHYKYHTANNTLISAKYAVNKRRTYVFATKSGSSHALIHFVLLCTSVIINHTTPQLWVTEGASQMNSYPGKSYSVTNAARRAKRFTRCIVICTCASTPSLQISCDVVSVVVVFGR